MREEIIAERDVGGLGDLARGVQGTDRLAAIGERIERARGQEAAHAGDAIATPARSNAGKYLVILVISALTAQEEFNPHATRELRVMLRKLANAGTSIIAVTHHLLQSTTACTSSGKLPKCSTGFQACVVFVPTALPSKAVRAP